MLKLVYIFSIEMSADSRWHVLQIKLSSGQSHKQKDNSIPIGFRYFVRFRAAQRDLTRFHGICPLFNNYYTNVTIDLYLDWIGQFPRNDVFSSAMLNVSSRHATQHGNVLRQPLLTRRGHVSE